VVWEGLPPYVRFVLSVDVNILVTFLQQARMTFALTFR
jgi:hypothetical protein